jgi:malonyl-CoA/methylmalonyl-CoA synthetase
VTPPAESVRPPVNEAWARHVGQPIDVDRLRAQLLEASIPDALKRTASRHPRRQALRIDGSGITFGELDERADRGASWLSAHGVSPGDRVLIASPNSLEMVVAYLAVVRAGGINVLASSRLARAELVHLVEDSRPVMSLAQGPGLVLLRGVVRQDASPTPIVVLAGRRRAGEIGLSELLDAPADPGLPLPAPDRVAQLAYTSGTTGRPKATPLTHANLLSSIHAAMFAWRWSEEDLLVHALPLSHGHGLSGVLASLIAGSRAVIHDRFDPERLCRAIEDLRATVVFAVPTIYQRLLEWESIGRIDFSSVRLPVSGSAALSPHLAHRCVEVLGQLPLERYGTTESGLNLSNPYEGPRKPGSVGLPLPGVEVALVKEGRPVSDGVDGEIVVRGPQVFSGYWHTDRAGTDTFYPGGWFRTGDIGRVDPADGYISITGRSKELIISGGLNIYSREIELVLEEHPSVRNAAVVGVPSERWGEEVTAFLVPAEGRRIDLDELTLHLRERVAGYKCPKRFIVVEALPRNAVGKVVREQLMEMVGQKPGRSRRGGER